MKRQESEMEKGRQAINVALGWCWLLWNTGAYASWGTLETSMDHVLPFSDLKGKGAGVFIL